MPENRFFDKRCAPHYISTGALSADLFQKHLDALPDLSEKACPSEVRFEGEEPQENPEPSATFCAEANLELPPEESLSPMP